MKRAWRIVLSACALLLVVACSNGELESFDERASYAVGVDIGNNVIVMEAALDVDALIEGLRDVLSQREPRMSPQEVREILQEFFAKVQEDKARRRSEETEKNMREGETFLAENKTNAGVVETASGLQYLVLTPSDGPSPRSTDRVTVHYEGKLLDGKVFDSSYERGEPMEFALDSVIPGWTEGVQLMTVGSKYRLFIPSRLAYGARGVGQDIGPNATLVFEVELLAMEQQE